MMDNTITGTRQIVYEFSRAAMLEGWWIWALVVAAIGLLLFGCIRYYRRDAAELSAPVRWTLISLRLAAVIALVFFFFDLQRRTQRMVTRSSEVVVLVDTSQSMSLPVAATGTSQSRSERAAEVLGKTDLLTRLESEHRVSVYGFDDQSEPRLVETRGGQVAGDEDDEAATAESPVSMLAILGAICLAAAIILSLSSLLVGASGRVASVGWILVPTAATLIIGTLLWEAFMPSAHKIH